MKYLQNSLFLLLYFTWITAFAADEKPVVAIAEFSTQRGTYESRLTAQNISAQVQAALSEIGSIRLVERAQLELAVKELDLSVFTAPSAGESLSVGRWVGADLIVLGDIYQNPKGMWAMSLEVVDTVEADVLAKSAFLLGGGAEKRTPDLDTDALAPIGVQLIEAALNARALKDKATLVLAPLFFDFIGNLRNLEPLGEDFLTELMRQGKSTAGMRVLEYPRLREVRHEMELRMDGLTEMSLRNPARSPIFAWGDIEETDAEGKEPDEVMLRARVSLRTSGGEQREIEISRKAGEAPALMKELAGWVIGTAEELSKLPGLSPGPNPAAASKLLEQARLLYKEFGIRGRAREPVESQLRLGHHIDALYQLAEFFSPDDADILREHLLLRPLITDPDHSLTFAKYQQQVTDWNHFDRRFPGHHTSNTLPWATYTSTILLRHHLLNVPQDWPEDVWTEWAKTLQTQIVGRLRSADAEMRVDNANAILFNQFFSDAGLRTEFIELLWPAFSARSLKFKPDPDRRIWWEKTLREAFTAINKPERADELMGKVNWDTAATPEPKLPTDLRFEVRRPDILPPLLDYTPRLLISGETLTAIDALHFDGERLWVGAQAGPHSSDNLRWRQRMVERGKSNKLFRLTPGEDTLKSVSGSTELPSSVCAFTSDKSHLWAGTQADGILQLELEIGALVKKWDITTGLPTRNVYALESRGGSVIAGGGEQHRGHFFRITSGANGVVNLPLPGWSEEYARSRNEDIPKSEFGEVSILHRAHGRIIAVAGGSQAILRGENDEEAINLTESVLGGDSRNGPKAHDATVIAVTDDGKGWWLGTNAGLARLNPDGAVMQRWNTPRGSNSFGQRGWVPSMRSDGRLGRGFRIDTRMVGAVTAVAADGDFLFVAVSTEVDGFIPSPLEGAHLYVMNIPSGKWLGRVKLPARATAMAQDEKRLWIGSDGPDAVILEFDKGDITNVPPETWFSDMPSQDDLDAALGKLSSKEQACYAFFRKDYRRVLKLLSDRTIGGATVGELFLIAFSCDGNGLAQPVLAEACFKEILERQPHSYWKAEAEKGIAQIKKISADAKIQGSAETSGEIDFPIREFLKRGEEESISKVVRPKEDEPPYASSRRPFVRKSDDIECEICDHGEPGSSGAPQKMVAVEGGSLSTVLGKNEIGSFQVSNTEVTWSRWKEVQAWAVKNGYDLEGVGEGKSDDHPVTHVSWYDVLKWCNAASEMENLRTAYTHKGAIFRTGRPAHQFHGKPFLPENAEPEWEPGADGYRLPSAAEWEFAARGGMKGQAFRIYSGSDELNEVGWCNTNTDHTTHHVGHKAPNELGLYDMTGNAQEWCWDPGKSYRQTRGGGSNLGGTYCTVSHIFDGVTWARWKTGGFRIFRNLGK